MRVLIVGAGIGGLTTALSLHAAGSRGAGRRAARELRPLGVGINLLPHAVRELTELGLGDELAAIGIPTAETASTSTGYGQPDLGASRAGWAPATAGRSTPSTAASCRCCCCEAVRRAARRRRRPHRARVLERLRAGRRAGRRACMRPRAGGTAGAVTADVLVGADGIHSAVRAPAATPARARRCGTAILLWRGITEAEPVPRPGATHGHGRRTPRQKFVAYPISTRRTAGAGRCSTGSPSCGSPDDRPEHARTGTARAGSRTSCPDFADWKFDWLDVPALIVGSPTRSSSTRWWTATRCRAGRSAG